MAGLFGITAPILGFTMIFLAIRLSPWFNWTGNALSDLGVSGLGAIIFNNGLLMTGSFMMVFFLGLYELSEGNRLGRLGSGLFFASALLLCAIGFYPEPAGVIHLYVSVAFFVSIPMSMFTLGTFMVRNDIRKLGMLSFIAGASTVVVWMPSWRGFAIPEIITALALGVWSSVIGVWMRRVTALGEDPSYVPGERYGVPDMV
jgi:hypothetical membrane protein